MLPAKVKGIGFLRRIGASALGAVLVALGICCTAGRSGELSFLGDIPALTARGTMPGLYRETSSADKGEENGNGEEKSISREASSSGNRDAGKKEEAKKEETSRKGFVSMEPTDEEKEKYISDHRGEDSYPVYEFTSTMGNQAGAGVQIKNTSSYDPDIEKELELPLGFKTEKTDKPQVLIYHTHTTEAFLTYDTGYYFESYTARSKDSRKNVCAVGEEIVRSLENRGIKAVHDTTIHDSPSYSGAYYRSADTVREYLRKYPSIKVVIDIHRDGIGNEEQRSKPVFEYKGKKAAQLMILAGYNSSGDPEFEHWEYNFRFALRLQKKANALYPDMARPVNFGDFVYNSDINTGSLLVEIGADSNTLEEVRYTGYLFGNVLYETLKENA